MPYRASEEQPSMWQQRGQGASRAHHCSLAARPEKEDPSLYLNEDQDTSADKTLVFATQGRQSGQRDFPYGKGDGNFKAARRELPRYRAQPPAKGGVAKEITGTKSETAGDYDQQYCPFLKRNVLVKEKSCDQPALRNYILWASHPLYLVKPDEYSKISTCFTFEIVSNQMFMIFSAKADRFRDAKGIKNTKTEGNIAKKGPEPERASATAEKTEKTDESQPNQAAKPLDEHCHGHGHGTRVPMLC
jgi:hypothetical protein